MFALEPFESMPTNYYMTTPLLPRHCALRVLHLSANTPRYPRRLSLAELPTEAKVFLTLLIKVFAQDFEASRIDPFCGDAEFMRSVWKRHDAPTGGGDTGGGGARVLTPLISALNRLNNQRPSLIGHLYPDTRRW
ncbi:hypothetical protein BJY52DRAFT_1188437 [Lactarius psammicola]|nr:hypothetical protein BJY52DRAFT_1188437 [Lactarius psammicola]